MVDDHAVRAASQRFQLARLVGSEPAATPARVQVLLDGSLSMTSGDGVKERRARELAMLFVRLGEAAGGVAEAHVLRGEGRDRRVAADSDRVAQIPFDGSASLGDSIRAGAWGDEPAAARVVVSDFLFPDDPAPLVESLAAGAGRLWLVQVLDEHELNPQPAGPTALFDPETDETIEVVLDAAAVEAYAGRLRQHCDRLQHACDAVGAGWASCSAKVELPDLCRTCLLPAGLVVAR